MRGVNSVERGDTADTVAPSDKEPAARLVQSVSCHATKP